MQRLLPLQSLLDSHPEWATLLDWEVSAAIGKLTVTVPADAPTKAIRRYLLLSGAWANLLIASHGTGDIAKLALTITEALQPGSFDSLDTATKPDVAAAISGLCDAAISAGLVTQTDKDAIFALSSATIPWAQSVGLGHVTDRDVGQCRAGNLDFKG